MVKNSPANARDLRDEGSTPGQEDPLDKIPWTRSPGQDPLEQEMAAHSSILTWEIPRTEKRGRLQSMGSQRVRHD